MDTPFPDPRTPGERPPWAPLEVDLDRPSSARIYDYMLGGSHNFGSDREMAEQLLAADPRIGPTAHANRAFLRRAVEFLAGQGVRQFLDLGSGIPTLGNVHEVARLAAPDARVVYVDNDPVAVAHSRAIVGDDDRVVILQTNLCEPASIMADPQVTDLLDFTEPIAVLLVAVLHFIPDEADPAGIIATLRDAVPSGSYLVISQASWPSEQIIAQGQETLARYRQATAVALRHVPQIEAFFAGFELVDPGLVHVASWRPDPDSSEDPALLMPVYAGVGVKP